MNNLTLVIPAKNEKLSLPQVLNELKKFNIKSIIVVHPSDEETIKATKIFQDCEIILQDGKGYGDALIKGINSVNTELFSIFNADGSFNPNEINLMAKKLEGDQLDFVFASRYQSNSGSEDDTFLTMIGNFVFTFIGKIFFSLKINQD